MAGEAPLQKSDGLREMVKEMDDFVIDPSTGVLPVANNAGHLDLASFADTLQGNKTPATNPNHIPQTHEAYADFDDTYFDPSTMGGTPYTPKGLHPSRSVLPSEEEVVRPYEQP